MGGGGWKLLWIRGRRARLGCFGVSYAFSQKYASKSTVLVEGQKVPDTLVQSVITAVLTEGVQTVRQQGRSRSRVRPVIQSLALVKSDDENKLIEDIQHNMTVEPVITSMSTAGIAGAKKKKASAADEPLPGFNVNYTDNEPVRAQKICNAMALLIVDENLRSRAEAAKGTTDFLGRQVEDAKRAIDEQDAKLATFKKQYMGQLPSDVDNNMRMLMSLNTQLDATTQTLARAQQDKAYTESMLAQQTAAWKSSPSTTTPQTLEEHLSQLQATWPTRRHRHTH